MPERVFVDMDGVLVDWYFGAVRAVGHTFELPSPQVRPVAILDLMPPGMTRNRMWAHINAQGESFWKDLPIYPWAMDLVQACRAIAPTTLLSTPSLHPSSRRGKIAWMQQVLGDEFGCILSHDKAGDCGRPGAVLIDDYEVNTSAWTAKGGHAILFPHIGNRRFKEAGDPLPPVLAELQAMAHEHLPL